jgi:ATP synthase protein I
MANPQGPDGPEGDGSGRSATTDLAARIARARGERSEAGKPSGRGGTTLSGANRAFRLASEFVAAIIVGAGLGYGIDMLFGTRPWGMVILLLVGFAAGVLNVVRASAEMNAAATPDLPSVKDEDDE